MNIKENLKAQLNSETKEERLLAIKEIKALINSGAIAFNEKNNDKDVNNHVHTSYSFSPYSPSKAVFEGYMAGLKTIGIMDHDSVSGTKEFLQAAKMIGIAATIGVECRVDMSSTPFKSHINNPDQAAVAYVALHGIPHSQIDTVAAFFSPYSTHRNIRNRKMTENINKIISPFGLNLDFENDIIPISMFNENGSITERHLLFALAKKIIAKFGKGENVVEFLTNSLNIPVEGKVAGYLNDIENPFYEYDLLGALKSNMVSMFYINATDECPKVEDFIKLAKKVGAISTYAYLGDIAESVTGDKKAQKFEDDYLEDLFKELKHMGFNAITYMPSRNTKEQLMRVRKYCDDLGFFQISGEDINSPRQSFICLAQRDDMFKNLYDAAWALIGHEKASSENLENSFFSAETQKKYPLLKNRIEYYKSLAKN